MSETTADAGANPITATNLRELHALHQRAKAIRDRLESGPKTLAARRKVLESKRAELEKAQKGLKDARAHNKNREGQLQQIEGRIDDYRVKLNQAKKQADFDAIRNQIAHDNSNKARVEDEILQAFEALEAQAASVAAAEANVKGVSDEVDRMAADLDAQRGPAEAQLAELEAGIAAAEVIIPEEQRDQYRRLVKQLGPDAMAQVEDGACHGCYVAMLPQMMNDLINGGKVVFCRTCGRVLYLPEQEEPRTKRKRG